MFPKKNIKGLTKEEISELRNKAHWDGDEVVYPDAQRALHLKRCPFCGGKDIALNDSPICCTITCNNPNCPSKVLGSSYEESARAWNHRATLKEKIKADIKAYKEAKRAKK